MTKKSSNNTLRRIMVKPTSPKHIAFTGIFSIIIFSIIIFSIIILSSSFVACGTYKKKPGPQPGASSMGSLTLASGEVVIVDGKALSALLSNTNENMKASQSTELAIGIRYSSADGTTTASASTNEAIAYKKYLVKVKSLACDISAKSGARTATINYAPLSEASVDSTWETQCVNAGNPRTPIQQICVEAVNLANSSQAYLKNFDSQLSSFREQASAVRNRFYDLYSAQSEIAKTMENLVSILRCPSL